MNRKRFLGFILSVCALLMLLGGIFLLINVPAQEPQQGQIAFESYRNGGKGDIFVMDADGKNIRNLTNHPASDRHPAWSPDGSTIAFWVDDWRGRDIYLMNADGTNLRKLTNHPAVDEEPSWSPDGRKITFVSNRDGKWNSEIYVMDADGSNVRRLTDHPARDWSPSWSPDGQRIIFTSQRTGPDNIWVMDSDGANPQNITNNPTFVHTRPAWSPDGQWIVFNSNRLDLNMEIYMIDINGKNLRRLTNHPTVDLYPRWFDPAFVLSVSSAGKLRAIWGQLKQNSK